jgi:hypothetical protein
MLGTALIMIVSEYLRDYQEARLIIVGLILLLTIVLAPRGVVPALQEGWARVQRWMAEDEEEAPAGGEREPEASPVESGKGTR